MTRLFQAIAIAAVLVVVAAVRPALADDRDGPPGSDVRVYVPSGWKTEAAREGSEGLLIAIAPGEQAGLLYAVVEAKNAEAALKAVDRIVGKVVKDAKVTKGGKININGMDGIAIKGTGMSVDDDKPVSIAAVIVQPNANHVLFAVGMAETAVRAKYKAEFDKALAGIRKTK